MNGAKHSSMVFFSGAYFFCPNSVVDAEDEDIRKGAKSLSTHPNFDSNKEEELACEMVEFKKEIVSKAQEEESFDVSSWTSEINLLDYHFQHRAKRPLMFFVALLVALVQPTSASVERVFSRYRNLFREGQQSMLWDEKSSGKTISMMLSWNGRVPPRVPSGGFQSHHG